MRVYFRRIVLAAMLLAFVVIVLGAYVRLSDAGLGCPDWPGCYGVLIGVPESAVDIEQANNNYDRPVEVAKAWKEVIHRYFAGTLGILIFIIAFLLIRKDADGRRQPIFAVVLLSLLLLQALLGMWTVTLQLKPLIVVAHLLGGFAIFNLLGWQWLRSSPIASQTVSKQLSQVAIFAKLAIAVLIVQIALGGWVSSNYAALACTDFPMCQQQWWPPMDLQNGFILWRGIGADYEFGVLDHPARVAIHMVHRLGALLATAMILVYLVKLFKYAQDNQVLRRLGMLSLVALLTQLSLGMLNVVLHLPLPIAVLHNGVALILLFSLVSGAYVLKYKCRSSY